MCYLLLLGPIEDYIPVGEDPGTGFFQFQRCRREKVCVEITIIDDNILEGSEFFIFKLSVKTNGKDIAFAADQRTGIVHIKDPGLSTKRDTLPVVTTPIMIGDTIVEQLRNLCYHCHCPTNNYLPKPNSIGYVLIHC